MKMESRFRNKTSSWNIPENSTFKYLFSYDVIIITERGNKRKEKHYCQNVNICHLNTYDLKKRHFFATDQIPHKPGNISPALLSLPAFAAKSLRPIRSRISNITTLIRDYR